MDNFSEEHVKKDCPHCDPNSFALKHPLKETKHFWVVCDVHPLEEGHVLIIPKNHFSCIAEYPLAVYTEFLLLYQEVTKFIQSQYGSVATFEHGKIGQTVFHSHVHLLPYAKSIGQIIPEGKKYLKQINNISDLQQVFKQDDKYLFVSIGNKMWVVDVVIGAPRFFRDRFAIAIGDSGRGNWKTMHENKELMKKANEEIKNLEIKWLDFVFSSVV